MTTDLHLSADEAALYNLLPENGSTVANGRAQEALRWPDQRYWAARDGLDNRKLVARGPGRGGTLRRVVQQPSEQSQPVEPRTEEEERVAAQAVETTRREEELYDPILGVLTKAWAKDRRSSPTVTEITARQGRRQTGGRWSRPDLVWVEVRTFEYLPTKVLDVITFEVKPSDAIDVQAVYEALAHRRAATHAYVVLDVPDAQAASLADTIQAVVEAAREHGVGVITMGSPADYATWEELQRAERVEPSPERLNDFLDTQLSLESKTRIRKAIR